MPVAIPVIKLGTGSFLNYILIWLGVSIAMHSFPSTGDANSMLSIVKTGKSSFFLKVVLCPIVGLIYVGAIGSVIWLNFIYGMAVAAFIHNVLVVFLS